MHEVERVMTSFLKDNMQARFIYNKFINSFQAIKKAQGSWRDYNQRKEGFKSCLMLVWERNFDRAFEAVMDTLTLHQSSTIGVNLRQ